MSNNESRLYFECHVTTEPVLGDRLAKLGGDRREALLQGRRRHGARSSRFHDWTADRM